MTQETLNRATQLANRIKELETALEEYRAVSLEGSEKNFDLSIFLTYLEPSQKKVFGLSIVIPELLEKFLQSSIEHLKSELRSARSQFEQL